MFIDHSDLDSEQDFPAILQGRLRPGVGAHDAAPSILDLAWLSVKLLLTALLFGPHWAGEFCAEAGGHQSSSKQK